MSRGYDCIVCGQDTTRDKTKWRAVATAAGHRFVCDKHPPGGVRDAVAVVERPETLEPAPWID